METRGFNREYRTGQIVHTALEPGGAVSYRDVRVNPDRQDDHAASAAGSRSRRGGEGAGDRHGRARAATVRELRDRRRRRPVSRRMQSRTASRGPSASVIRATTSELIDSLRVSDMAVCTSGDYERRSAGEADGHHILDPRTGASANAVASATVVAPTAMSADALATAAFVLGPTDGIRLLERQGVDGLIVSPTSGALCDARSFRCRGPTILSNAERPSHHRPRDSDRHRRAGRGRRAGGAGLASAVAVAALIDAPILRRRRKALGVSQRSDSHGRDRRDGLEPAGTLVRPRLHVRGRDRQQVRLPHSLGERVQSGGAGPRRHVLRVRHGPELVGRPAGRHTVDRTAGALRDRRLHHRPGQQDPAGARVPGQLLPAVHRHGVRGRSRGESQRSL